MGGAVKAVEKTFSKAGKALESGGQKIGKGIEKAGKGLGKAVENVAKNPLPVIETIALTYVTGNPALAAAAVSAANGGNIKQITTAAVAGYAGGEVASSAGAGATSAGASAETARIAASAAGASTSTVVSAVASGQPLNKALEAGLASGVVSGATTGVIEEAKQALASPPTGAAMKAATSTVPAEQAADDYSVKADYSLPSQTSVSGLGLTDKIPTGGGQGLVVDPNIILPPSLSQYGTDTGRVRGTDTGGLQPAYTSAADKLTPPSFDTSLTGTTPETPYKEPPTISATSEPVVSETVKTASEVARPFVSGALSELFGLGPKVPGAPSAGSSGGPAPVSQGVSTGTTVGLTGERGAGEIESKETGQPRKNVWNEASLRLKDALGV
jgi:hypothetical protein